jgi:hypothetical protein
MSWRQKPEYELKNISFFRQIKVHVRQSKDCHQIFLYFFTFLEQICATTAVSTIA